MKNKGVGVVPDRQPAPPEPVLIIPRDFQFGFDTKNNLNLFIFSILCWRTAIRNSSESAVYLYLLVV